MDFDQGELDFDSNGSADGWKKWRRELEEKKRAFEARHGIILGKRVQVRLRGEFEPLEGAVRVVSKRAPAASAQLRLGIGAREFIVAELESIVRLEDE
jgi:hypothetical protein